MGAVKVECVVKEQNQIGEGPVWEEKDATLLFVDIYGPKISRWNSLTNQIESMHTGEPIRYQLYCDLKTLRCQSSCISNSGLVSHFTLSVLSRLFK